MLLFELGLFISELGRDKVALVVAKDKKGNLPKVPTDLAGLSYISFEEKKIAKNEVILGKWLQHLSRLLGNKRKLFKNPFNLLEEQYSRLPEDWKDEVQNYIIAPFKNRSIEALRGDFSLDVSQYYDSLFSNIQNSTSSTKIYALSILSYEFWSNAPFQGDYLKHNIDASNRGVDIRRLFLVNKEISPKLWKIIQTQLKNGIKVRSITPKIFSKFIHLEDMVIIKNGNEIRSYISNPFFSNGNHIKSVNLNLNNDYCHQLIQEFNSGWNLASIPSAPNIPSKNQVSSTIVPGKTMKIYSLNKDVISCEEAAKAREVPLENELKTMILATTDGYVATHIPGDGKISLRAIKKALQVKNAHIASPKELQSMGLSPGTVSAVLEPVWSLPHLISKRTLLQDYVTTNNGTTRQYFKFKPEVLLDANKYLLGNFEK